ncbi:putative transport related, membrane protein [Bacteroides heparinolyticus]|uniref:Putative transport related, membrane protein n=1 Tax=Prevotella heparinolytica TaxID=28113 RepID=A0A449I354_9BACE|nr:putative transport related, membrane protein [Bacteroides heparinolyticus]
MDRTTEQPRLWTGSFIRICLVNFFIFVNFHALLPTFPFFISYLGGDAVTIGLATALFSIASIVSRPFVGWLVDTRGRFTIFSIGSCRHDTSVAPLHSRNHPHRPAQYKSGKEEIKKRQAGRFLFISLYLCPLCNTN